MRRFRVEFEGTVTIELDDAVINAVDDEWQDTFFDVDGATDIAGHIAWNMLANRLPLSRIDGWADQADYKAVLKDERWNDLTIVETTMP